MKLDDTSIPKGNIKQRYWWFALNIYSLITQHITQHGRNTLLKKPKLSNFFAFCFWPLWNANNVHMEASSHSSSWRDKLGAAMGFVSIFHAHTRWRYMRWQVTLTNHLVARDEPPRIRNLEHLLLKNWVWDGSRDNVHYTTLAYCNIIMFIVYHR